MNSFRIESKKALTIKDLKIELSKIPDDAMIVIQSYHEGISIITIIDYDAGTNEILFTH